MVEGALSLGLTLLAGAVFLISGYLFLLTLAALVARRAGPPPGPGNLRFALLVPAHNEELLIERLLRSLASLDYPRARFDVCVVADNCTDATARLARAAGARVYERTDHSARSKGHALRWLIQRLQAEGQDYGAYVVLDADSEVGPGFLRAMEARLAAGSQVVQGYYTVLNLRDSPVAALRFAALAAVHYVRPLGRSSLGLSCGLKGNGMCFAAPVLERYSWRWFTLAEDVEFHLALVKDGIRVEFAPEARVLADMPVSLSQAASQNARWERGRLQMLRQYVPSLLGEGLVRRNPLRLDAAIEQCIPPLSVPLAAAVLSLAASLLAGLPIPSILAALAVAALTIHVFAGLVAVRAPGRVYLALAYAPVYVLWKLWLYVRAMASSDSAPWVRTARTLTPSD